MFSKTCGLPTYTVGPHTVHMLATCYVALYKDNILFICQKMEFTDKKCFRSSKRGQTPFQISNQRSNSYKALLTEIQTYVLLAVG